MEGFVEPFSFLVPPSWRTAVILEASWCLGIWGEASGA